MDTYSTKYLAGVVNSLKRTPAFALNTFFRNVSQSTAEDVYFDVELDGRKRRLAPVQHPLAEGKVVESLGFETRSFRPAYVKDKRVHDPNRPFKREIGEEIGTGQNLTPMQRRELAIRRDLRDQVDLLTRRMEVWAVEVLRTGQLTINMQLPGGAVETVVLNFQRDASLTIDLTPGNLWTDTSTSPMTNIEDWSLLALQKSGSTIRNILMDPDAWRAFRDKVELEKRLDLRRVTSGEINLGLVPEHVQYKGTDGNYDYWVYADWYIADGQTTEQVMLPSGTVIGVGQIDGVRHFGAIKDEAAGFQAMEYFVKSWAIEDPSVRYLLMQSAPIVVPYRPNACFAASVL